MKYTRIIAVIMVLSVVLLAVAGCSSEPKQITLDQPSISLYPGETAVLTVTAEGAQVQFASDNEAVATVDASGKITAVAEGEANITVSADKFESAVCKVSVLKKDEPKPITVTVEGGTLTLNPDGTYHSEGNFTGLGFDIPFTVDDTFTIADGVMTIDNAAPVVINLFGENADLTPLSVAEVKDGTLVISIMGNNGSQDFVLAAFTISAEDATTFGITVE